MAVSSTAIDARDERTPCSDANGDPIAEDRLTRLLGGVAEPLFERLFGIDHEALVSGGQALLVERGREAEALFGTGLGSTAVHALLESLEHEAQSLFAPRASKPLINAELGRLADIERQQRDVTLSARHWDEARKAVDTATKQLKEIDTELTEAEKRRSALERIRRTLPGLAKRTEIREQLDSLDDVPILEDDFGPRREAAISKRRIAAEGHSKTTARLEGLRQDAALLEVSEELLAEAEAIDELRERLGGYRKAARDRPGLIARRATLVEQARPVQPAWRQTGSTARGLPGTVCSAYRTGLTERNPSVSRSSSQSVSQPQELVPGSGKFKQQIEDMPGRQTVEKPKGRPGKKVPLGYIRSCVL